MALCMYCRLVVQGSNYITNSALFVHRKVNIYVYPIFVPNCTFLACFGTIYIWQVMWGLVHNLAKCSWDKMPIVRPYKPDMPLAKNTDKAMITIFKLS